MNLANKMESSGRPGMVHISEKTHAFIKDEYFVEDGDPIQGRTTETQKEKALLTLNSLFSKEFETQSINRKYSHDTS